MTRHCCFFGHRFILTVEEVQHLLRTTLIKLIEKDGVDFFYTGTHGMFDKMAYQLLLDLKKRYPHIQIMVAHSSLSTIKNDPCPAVASFVPVSGAHWKAAITKRNNWVIDNSEYVVCYVDVRRGGAYKAMTRALKLGKNVINLTSFLDE